MNIKTNVDFGHDGFKIEAEVCKDGNQWCCLAGEDLQSGIAGFGFTAAQAISDFKSSVRNEAAKGAKK